MVFEELDEYMPKIYYKELQAGERYIYRMLDSSQAVVKTPTPTMGNTHNWSMEYLEFPGNIVQGGLIAPDITCLLYLPKKTLFASFARLGVRNISIGSFMIDIEFVKDIRSFLVCKVTTINLSNGERKLYDRYIEKNNDHKDVKKYTELISKTDFETQIQKVYK